MIHSTSFRGEKIIKIMVWRFFKLRRHEVKFKSLQKMPKRLVTSHQESEN